MSKNFALGAIGLLAIAAIVAGWMLFSTPSPAKAQTITVHKTPWCGCCTEWVGHLRDNGFHVVVKEEEDLSPVRAELGVPDRLMSCHTGEIDGYAIEGHVPAAEIIRLLKERPKATGLSVPGMPQGSPGMETSSPPDTYDVVIFSPDKTGTYASYRGNQKLEGVAD
jgi:hypothetical protein